MNTKWEEELDKFIPQGIPGKNLYKTDLSAFIKSTLEELINRIPNDFGWQEQWVNNGIKKDLADLKAQLRKEFLNE